MYERVRYLNKQNDTFATTLDFTLATRGHAEAEALIRLLAWYGRVRREAQ